MRFISILALLLVVLSCQKDKKNVQSLEISDVPKLYERQEIIELSGPCAEDSASNRCLNIRVEVPFFLADTLGDMAGKLNEQVKKDIFAFSFPEANHASYDSLISELASEHERILNDYPDYNQPWNLEILSDIIYETKDFVSMATNVFYFTGGAHPNNSQIYASYDLKTGKRIALEDILKPDALEELNRAAEIEFRMLKRIPPDITLEEEGYRFENDRFSLNNNFAILNKSLIFYFNPYEIGAYTLGSTELQLNFTDYAHLIKNGSFIDN